MSNNKKAVMDFSEAKTSLGEITGRKKFPISPAYREERERLTRVLKSRPESEQQETKRLIEEAKKIPV